MKDEQPHRTSYSSAAPGHSGCAALIGTKDGAGAGDHDQPFAGFRAYQFSTRQFARLLLLRGELLDAKLRRGFLAANLDGILAIVPEA